MDGIFEEGQKSGREIGREYSTVEGRMAGVQRRKARITERDG